MFGMLFEFQLFVLYRCGVAMKFSRLAILVTLLLQGFGEVGDGEHTHVQEEFAGVGNIACAARLFRLVAARRDVSCLMLCLHWMCIFEILGSLGLVKLVCSLLIKLVCSLN